MKLPILIALLLTHACFTAKPADSNQPITQFVKTPKPLATGINGLSKNQKEQIKLFLSDITLAVRAYKNTDDSNDIAAKCDKLTVEIDNLTSSLPPGLFRNSLQQGSSALNLAYLFRYEKAHAIEIPLELRKQVIDTYKISDIREEERPAKIFNFAQAHFEIAARMAADEGIY